MNRYKIRICYAVLFLIIVILSIWLIKHTRNPADELFRDVESKYLQHGQMQQIRRNLWKAFRAARSSEARLLIENTLQLLDAPSPPDTTQTVSTPKPQRPEVCPEYWGDVRKDQVYFEDVYQTVSCDRIPLEELVELLLYANSCSDGKYLVDRIRLVYPTIHIQLALGTDDTEPGCNKLQNVQVHFQMREDAATWTKLSSISSTKYILVGRNMVDFTHYTDIDRMIRAMNSLQVDVVGGAVRLEPEGLWYAGCYQATLRNFTLRIHPGHEISAQSCAYCDYIASPFLIRRVLFRTAMKASTLSGPAAFVQMFLDSLQKTGIAALQTISCVDVLFHVAGRQYGSRSHGISEAPKFSWVALAKQWVLNRIVLPGGVDHQWTCSEVDIRCGDYKIAGAVLPGCCIEELAGCLKAFLALAKQYDVSAFLVSGTLLGAVKISGGFLPWERDADLVWDAYKHAIVEGPIKTALGETYGCQLGPIEFYSKFGLDIKACSKTTNNSCIYYPLRSKSWRIQLYGDPIIAVTRLWGLQNTTQINLNGMWTTAPPNPGRYVRNVYGDNILGHVQHWLDYGLSTGWDRYTNVENKRFKDCPYRIPRHACLRGNYMPLGNIQFQDFPL